MCMIFMFVLLLCLHALFILSPSKAPWPVLAHLRVVYIRCAGCRTNFRNTKWQIGEKKCLNEQSLEEQCSTISSNINLVFGFMSNISWKDCFRRMWKLILRIIVLYCTVLWGIFFYFKHIKEINEIKIIHK